MQKTCKKPFYSNIRAVLCKKPLEKTANLREMGAFKRSDIFQMLQRMQRLYSLRNGQFGSKIKKCQKHAKNHTTITLELLCAKNCSKKQQIFEKWEHFENRSSCKGYSPCKGYSLCEMVNLGQKLKVQKTAQKNRQIFEKFDNFENLSSCKCYSPCKELMN